MAIAVYYGVRNSQTTQDMGSGKNSTPKTTGKKAVVPIERGKSWAELDDPSQDGWQTEVFANQAKKQLYVLGDCVMHSDTKVASKLVTDTFACEPLKPEKLVTVIDDDYLKIVRIISTSPLQSLEHLASQSNGLTDLRHRGKEGLIEASEPAFGPFRKMENINFKAKVFKVAKTKHGFLTRQFVGISGSKKAGHQSAGKVEQHATWDIAWILGEGDAKPRIEWIRVVDFEQSESHHASGTLFKDCTKSALGGNPAYERQFLQGMNHWLQRIQAPGSDVLSANSGIAVGDLNGDGLDDLYVCQEAGLPNRLFIQRPDGTAHEESAAWKVNWLQSSRSALIVDLDNDHDQDLLVAIYGGILLAENDGKGQFYLREVLAAKNDLLSLTAVDYDLDGRLDIYACAYYDNQELGGSGGGAMASAQAGFVLHDANNGGRNVLFQNRTPAGGQWRFVDVTAEVGLDVNNHRYSMAASWDDFDNDGDQDLYVANDYGRDHMYRNDYSIDSSGNTRCQFVDISDVAHVEDSATGMSTSWADYDRDGWMDVLIGNMWSSAGNRIAFQEQFKSHASADVKHRLQRFARGNTLLKNQGNGTFADHSQATGIEMGRWAWGTNFADLNNDGWEDIVVSNGFITTEDTGDL
jgi:hypothetical protein